jgi:hypothetical protein
MAVKLECWIVQSKDGQPTLYVKSEDSHIVALGNHSDRPLTEEELLRWQVFKQDLQRVLSPLTPY